MRLIDADELKKYAIPCDIHNGALTDLCVPLYQIDNAPTVKIDTNDIEYKAYCKGLEDGKKISRPQSEWIPVSERLPEKEGFYLVTLEYKEHGKGITTLWYHGKGIGWDLRIADVVIAWQPLPEPYKKGGEEE